MQIQSTVTDVGLNTRAVWMATNPKEARVDADRITDDFAQIDATIRQIIGRNVEGKRVEADALASRMKLSIVLAAKAA